MRSLGKDFATIKLEGNYLGIYQLTEEMKESWRLDPRFGDYQMVSKERIEKIETVAQYKLKKMPAKRLKKLRQNGQPGFILKKDGSYCYAKIDRKINFYGHNGEFCGEHLCAKCAKLGICKKVTENAKNIEDPEDMIIDTWHGNIEKYDFIKEGYETFNTFSNKLHVVECANYEQLEAEEEKSGRSMAKVLEILRDWCMI